MAGKAAALPEGKFIKVTKDTAICWADSDGCFNYILQANEARTANVLCKATGKKLSKVEREMMADRMIPIKERERLMKGLKSVLTVNCC